jgi:chromosome partitioning protein
MTTITFSAIKGGVGKSSLAILTANALAANGAKVLIIDADPQNSTTSYYFPEELEADCNLANILTGEPTIANIVSTSKVDIIPSSLELLRQRDCDTLALKAALQELEYDFCIIDTAPTLDNVVVSSLEAADVIVTPVVLTGFDFKSAVFFKKQLEYLDMLDKWALLINRYKPVKSVGSAASSILNLFSSDYFEGTLKTKVPESAAFKAYVETNTTMSRAKDKAAGYEAVVGFIYELTGEKIEAERF